MYFRFHNFINYELSIFHRSLFWHRTQWQFWKQKVTRFPNSRKQTQCSHRIRHQVGTMVNAVTIVVPNFRLHCANIIVVIVVKYFAANVRQRRARYRNSASKRKFVCATYVIHRCKKQRLMHRISELVMGRTICRQNIWIVRWHNNRK